MEFSRTIGSNRRQKTKIVSKYFNIFLKDISIHPYYNKIAPELINPDILVIKKTEINEKIPILLQFLEPIVLIRDNYSYLLISGLKTYHILKLFDFHNQKIKCILFDKFNDKIIKTIILCDIFFNQFISNKYNKFLPKVLKNIEKNLKEEKEILREIFGINQIKSLLKIFSIKEKEYYGKSKNY